MPDDLMRLICGEDCTALEIISRPEDISPASSALARKRALQGTGDFMSSLQVAIGDRIIEPMIALAGCSAQQRIVVAGSKSMELMLELHRRGYLGAAATGNCGRPAGQYDVALADWRRRTLRALEPTLDWLVEFLVPQRPTGVLGGCPEAGRERKPSCLRGETRLRDRQRHRA